MTAIITSFEQFQDYQRIRYGLRRGDAVRHVCGWIGVVEDIRGNGWAVVAFNGGPPQYAEIKHLRPVLCVVADRPCDTEPAA